MANPAGLQRARIGGVLLGIGLGGFLDGILLHQVLQWHHMLSSVLPPTDMHAMQVNMLWDGLFHLAVWVATLVGVFLVWAPGAEARPPRPQRWLLGLLLIGWGAFNLVEGLINHHLLGIHHVRGYGPDYVWDIGFLLTGPLLALLGGWLYRSADLSGQADG
jgi:uncharacterized membrane protein